ncbi:MAG: hypothetical protein MJ252_27585 [archaeon]|nr:hypothetical protein [archaeon]
MTCRKEAGGCGYEFCWICLDEWQKHGTSWYKCDFKKSSKVVELERKAETGKKWIERFQRYSEKYMDHQKGEQFARKLYDSIKEKKEMFANIKGIFFSELGFLDEAIGTIIDCRRMLKYSYCLGFYLKETKEIELYEHHQYSLDSLTDRLHECLEQEEIPRLLQIENLAEFNREFEAFRSKVINLKSTINTFKDNLLKDFEGKMDNLIDYDLLYGKKGF